MGRPVGIDLFAGVGGMSLGFEQAGFDIAAAVELDPIHAAAHAYNFPETKVIARSVTGLTGKEIRRFAGLGPKKVDVVFGGAPCQGFSMIGQRALDDPRNALVGDFVRIVSELDASYFVFENVKGMTVGRHKAFLQELIEEFTQHGYDVVLPWNVLNAADFGVPQNRQRLILMGAKRGLRLPRYPEKALKRITCGQALGDLPDPEKLAALWESDSVEIARWGKTSRYARGMRCSDPDAWGLGYQREWDKKLLTASGLSDHTVISKKRFAATEQGEVEPISRFFRLAEDGQSNTLRAGTDASRGAFTSPRPIHYAAARCITVREMARLHGFPDWFRPHSTKWHGAREIGNAVPPPLAKGVAEQIVKAMGRKISPPRRKIQLGDPALLTLDMKGAAALFGEKVLIAGRNRKSGAKKRKQADIERSLQAAA
jgi:DNA (cytosine-5)-methyltransferase 1